MLVFDQLKKNDPQLRLLTIAVLAGLGVLLVGLWWVQIVSAQDYQLNLETQASRTIRIPAVRGKILDRNGQAMAENAPSYDVGLYIDDLRDEFKSEYTLLHPKRIVTNSPPFWMFWNHSRTVRTVPVKLNKDQIENLTWKARYVVASNVVEKVGQRLQHPIPFEFDSFERHYKARLSLPYPLLPNLSPDLVARFEEQATSPDGVDLEIQSIRYYPLQTTAAHLLGHVVSDISSAEGEESYFTYRLPDYRGENGVGIECAYDAYLRGYAGVKSVIVNNQGYRQSETVWEAAEPGSNVVLTVDLELQKAVEDALQHGPDGELTRGAVVVMDVNTGDILAMASSPTFNPNYFVTGFPPGEHARMEENEAERNHATQDNYRPGSIFKPIVALACLENGMDPKAKYTVEPNPRDPFHGYIHSARGFIINKEDTAPPGDDYDFKKALIHSSNSYFIYNGLAPGVLQKIVELGRRFHLGQPIGINTRQEVPGRFPDQKRISSDWSVAETANLCIGQGDIDVTPLQMVVVASALANGGKVLWPRLVDSIRPQNPLPGEQILRFPKGQVRDYVGVRPSTIRTLQEAMLDDTESPGGTAYEAFKGSPVNTELRVCGKTGTAQNIQHGEKNLTTWFLSFAPYEHPHYAVVVMVEMGLHGSGGGTCAPIARKVYEAILKLQQTPAPRPGTVAQN